MYINVTAGLLEQLIQEQKEYKFQTKEIIVPTTNELLQVTTNTHLEKAGIHFIVSSTPYRGCNIYRFEVLFTKNNEEEIFTPSHFELMMGEPVIANEVLIVMNHLNDMFNRCTFIEFFNYVNNISLVCNTNISYEVGEQPQILSCKNIRSIPGGYWVDNEVLENPIFLPNKIKEFVQNPNILPLDLTGDVFISEKLMEKGFYLHLDKFTTEKFKEEYEAYLKENSPEPFNPGILTTEHLHLNTRLDLRDLLLETKENRFFPAHDFVEDMESEYYRSLLLIELDENRTHIQNRYLLTIEADKIQAVAILHAIDQLL